MLFFKECKKIISSMTFVLYAVTVVAMYVSQFLPIEAITKPAPGLPYYGTIEREEPEVLMPAATRVLITEYLSESYTAYPFGFYKEVRLEEAASEAMSKIIMELTDMTKEELDSYKEMQADSYEAIIDENGNTSFVYKESVMPEYEMVDLSYERFRELMVQADELIGGGSKYSEKYLMDNFSQIPMTYEEALAEYEEITEEENVAESYTRLYCDYMGIVLSIIPVFVCVGLWQLDKKSQMEQLIFSRKTSSAKLIGNRYVAMVVCMAIPVLLTFVHALMGVNRIYPEKDIAFVNAIGLGLYWLLPNIMIVTAAGALISELFAPLFAIFVQGIWWYTVLEMNHLTGDISKWTLIIRHNTLGDAWLFTNQFADFVWNRAYYIVLSILAVSLTMLIYEKKRKGASYGIKLRKNTKRKFEA